MLEISRLLTGKVRSDVCACMSLIVSVGVCRLAPSSTLIMERISEASRGAMLPVVRPMREFVLISSADGFSSRLAVRMEFGMLKKRGVCGVVEASTMLPLDVKSNRVANPIEESIIRSREIYPPSSSV